LDLQKTRFEVEDRIATITLARPHRKNAWTGRMHVEYRWCLASAERDPKVRVIVVTGDPAGAAFCAGADLGLLDLNAKNGEYGGNPPADIERPGSGVDPLFDAPFAYHFGLGKPVIAAINGPAAGIGLVLAAFADLRFAVAGAKFTAAHGRFNLPAELGLSWLLPRLVGVTHANDILLSSRVFTAEEALEMGFLNKVVPAGELMPVVMNYARNLADTIAPGSLRVTKNQIYRDLHRDVASAVSESERLINEMVREPDYAEGVRAWTQKRSPVWQEETSWMVAKSISET
jgi:enoyl-CoA hydratase/carnithine racemase